MIRIFIAYSSKDLVFKDEIRKRLRPLQRAGKVDVWDNYDIEAGKNWDAEVREKLENSDLILLLLSPDALDSDYFYEVEAPIALRRHEAGEAIAVGILLRPCDLKYTPFGDMTKYELLPKKGHPIVHPHWHHADEAYLTIFREVDILVEKMEQLQDGEKGANQILKKEKIADVKVKREKKVKSIYDIYEKPGEERAKKRDLSDWRNAIETAENTTDLEEKKIAFEDYLNNPQNKFHRVDAEERLKILSVQETLDRLSEIAKRVDDESEGNKHESKSVSPQNGQVIRDIPDGPEMVFVEGGRFIMGSNEDESSKPVHPVNVPSFWMGKYPITFDEYDAFCAHTGKVKPNDQGWGRGTRPVINVSGEDAQEYCKWLSEKTGAQYRLPSEAEWEFASRGGTLSKGYKFAGSNDLKEVGWYSENSESKTHPVGEKKPNELGLHDMSGNVWEWCQDAWHYNYKDAPDDGSVWIAGGDKTITVLRGGSWDLDNSDCRSANRDWYNRSITYNHCGFRCAKAAGEE